VDSAAQVADLLEPPLLKEFHSLHSPRAHLAKGHNLLAGIQLVQPLWQLGQGDEMSSDVGYFKFILVANIEQEEILAMIEAALQIFSLNFGDTHFGSSPFGSKTQNPPARSSSGGGSFEKDAIEISLSALQSPHARRHVRAAHTAQTTRRGLLGAKLHVVDHITILWAGRKLRCLEISSGMALKLNSLR
jgi:hypothetical protein